VYVKEAFVPSLDESVGAVAAAHGGAGGATLTLNYSTTPAWG
jgi:hypothetical protein